MENLKKLRAVQTLSLNAMCAKSRKEVMALKGYINLRGWQYTAYNSLINMAKNDGVPRVKRITLNEHMQVVGSNKSPVAILYLYKNQVSAFVRFDLRLGGRLMKMSTDLINTLPKGSTE